MLVTESTSKAKIRNEVGLVTNILGPNSFTHHEDLKTNGTKGL